MSSSFIMQTPFIIMIVTPFNNAYEFFTQVGIAFVLMTISMYFIVKKIIKINRGNSSIIDFLNLKISMISENSLFISFIISSFLLAVDSQDGDLNYFTIGIFCYFSVMFLISFFTKFNLTRNILIDGLTLCTLILFTLFGSCYEYKEYSIALFVIGILYVVFTAYDVTSLISYMMNPVDFLRTRKVNNLAQMMLSVRSDSSIDYFKYFKKVKIGSAFIHYDSFLGRIDIIMKDEYVIMKEANRSLQDKLFHSVNKEIIQGRFNEFFLISQKYIDEYSNVDKYAIFNLQSIKAYMTANHIDYHSLTDDDLKVLEMFQY